MTHRQNSKRPMFLWGFDQSISTSPKIPTNSHSPSKISHPFVVSDSGLQFRSPGGDLGQAALRGRQLPRTGDVRLVVKATNSTRERPREPCRDSWDSWGAPVQGRGQSSSWEGRTLRVSAIHCRGNPAVCVSCSGFGLTDGGFSFSSFLL